MGLPWDRPVDPAAHFVLSIARQSKFRVFELTRNNAFVMSRHSMDWTHLGDRLDHGKAAQVRRAAKATMDPLLSFRAAR